MCTVENAWLLWHVWSGKGRSKSLPLYIYVNQVLLVLTTPTQMWDAATVSCLRLPRLSSTLL